MELDFIFSAKDFLKLAVEVDEATVVSVLKPILFNVLPQCSNDTSSCLLPNAKDFLKLLTDQKSFGSAINPQTNPHCEFNLFPIVELWWEISLDAEAVEAGPYHASVFMPNRRLV